MDYDTDRKIQAVIREEFGARTMLMIAHRIETVLECDKIMVLSRGDLVEFDSCANLLANNKSLFFSLYEESRRSTTTTTTTTTM